MNYPECVSNSQQPCGSTMSKIAASHFHHQGTYRRGDDKRADTSSIDQHFLLDRNSSMQYSSSTINSTSHHLLPPYTNLDHYHGVHDNVSNGGNAYPGPPNMPRSAYWSDMASINRNLNTTGKTASEDACNISGDISASSSGMISGTSKGFANNTQSSSFSTTFDTTAGKSINSNFDYYEAEKSINSTEPLNGDELNSLKMQLQIKETQNECLESEIQKLKNAFYVGLNYKQREFKYEKRNPHSEALELQVPNSIEQIFKRLSTALNRKESELQESREALESILTALALNPTNSVTKYGRYDAEALAHKMVVRIETLTKENQEMAKMLAYGRAKEAQIELNLAKIENQELKDALTKLSQSVED